MIMDQFYTNPDVAEECVAELVQHVNFDDYEVILEPSAGKGSFFNLLPLTKRQGIDLEPKCDGVDKMDFFEFVPKPNTKYCVVGNPPFGRISSMAIKFFNHAANFADVIAFIIPKTFKRVSVQNRLNMKFHLIHNKDLPLKPCCFTPKMSAKCCFQIWVKKDLERAKIELPLTHNDFEFLALGPLDAKKQPTVPNGADFVVKAAGGNCGEVKTENLNSLRPKSWHWIKSRINVDILVDRIKTLDFEISKDTVRQDSIGRAELVNLYSCMYPSNH
jgi:hypothetical protein